MTIETIFYVQIGSVIGFVSALFVLYRLLVSQKDATIQLLREKNDFLSQQLKEVSKSGPDALAKSLSYRVKMLDDEIERLSKDKEKNQEEIRKKEKELAEVRREAAELIRKIAKAQEAMEEFFCPKCGAPMAERAFHSECAEYQGRELDIDHEYIAYECGYSLVDGTEQRKCRGNESRPNSAILGEHT